MASRPGTITLRALATMVSGQRFGDLPVSLRPAPIWTDRAEDSESMAQAWVEFAEVGWVTGDGGLDGDVAAALDVLARPSVEYTAVFTRDGRQQVAVVAGRGPTGMLARRRGDTVKLTVVRHGSWPELLLRQIPDAAPATVDSVTVPQTDLAGAGDEPFWDDRSRTGRSIHAVTELHGRPLTGQGELYVGVRDRYGGRRVSEPIRYQDYRIGRVVIVTCDGHLSVAPATKALLLSRLRAALERLGR